MKHYLLPGNRGQSLVEVLVAVAIGAILVIAAVTIITPALRVNTQATRVQVASSLAKGLSGNIRVWAESDWHNISNLATTSANTYYLIASSSPFTATSGIESVTVSTTTYARYFYVDDVQRDASGYIVESGGSNDPSTKKVTVSYNWPQGTTTTLSFYLTRHSNRVFTQTDWSGGPGQDGPSTTTNSQFSSSTSNISYSTPGSISLALGGGEGGGDWSNGYSYRRSITIDYTKVSSTLTNFPVLVSSTISDWKHTAHGGDITDVDGDDLIFTSDEAGETLLSFEREKHVSSTGAVYYWVKIPSLSNTTNTVVYAFYGNSSISSSQASSTNVWDSNYKGVWHLAETPSATNNDSTSNGVTCTPTSMEAGDQVSGRIDGSLNYDGAAEYSTCGDNLDFNLTDSVTVSAWIDPDTLPGAGADVIQQFFSKIDGESAWPGWNFALADGNGSNARLRLNYCDDCSGSARTYAATTQQISASDGWYHVVGAWVNEAITLYVNGVRQTNANSSTAATTNRNTSIPLVIGSCDSGTNCELFDGKIDEVRFSNAVRSSGWILTEYNNQSNPATFYTVGSEETP